MLAKICLNIYMLIEGISQNLIRNLICLTKNTLLKTISFKATFLYEIK